jgi:hypothetical protein
MNRKGANIFSLNAATENLKVLPAKLHNDSGVIGAAAFALHSMDKTSNSNAYENRRKMH